MSASRALSILLILEIFNKAITQQCLSGGTQESIFGWMLRGHIYKSMTLNHGHECLKVCRQDNRCQSFNWVISTNMCEFSDRTKKARPVDFVPHPDRYYYRRGMNRVPLGSIPELPAQTCKEIKASEEKAVSDEYWLQTVESRPPELTYCNFSTYEHPSCEAIKRSDPKASDGSYTIFSSSSAIPVYCDMTSDHGWTLIARFSNNDALHWMSDSALWWYDKDVASGETTDPSNNADMISSAFWLVSGTEFKITRSDDPQHTALLKTIGLCLSGETFRSKITNYGDFRNGKLWSKNQCLGRCSVHYWGQYQTTEGFKEAACNGTMQDANSIGFWCHWSSGDGSVMMIGGGGSSCNRADHGIGITEANSPSLANVRDSPEKDFGSEANYNSIKTYSLNLWVT